MASISAGNDDLIGTMIADAIDKVCPNGVLSIESSSSFETTVDVKEGRRYVLLQVFSPLLILNRSNPDILLAVKVWLLF